MTWEFILKGQGERLLAFQWVDACTESNSSCALKPAAYSDNVRVRVSKQGDSFLFSTNLHNPFEMNFSFPLHPRLSASICSLVALRKTMLTNMTCNDMLAYTHFSKLFISLQATFKSLLQACLTLHENCDWLPMGLWKYTQNEPLWEHRPHWWALDLS